MHIHIHVHEDIDTTECPECGATLDADGKCDNVGSCLIADGIASRMAKGETTKARLAPAAWTIRGNID